MLEMPIPGAGDTAPAPFDSSTEADDFMTTLATLGGGQ